MNIIKIFITLIFILFICGIYYLINRDIFSKTYMAHALGGVENTKYTNSKEAFENSYKKGFRFFEVDLTITPDGEIIAFHSMWTHKQQAKVCNNIGIKYIGKENIPSYKKFMALKLKTKATGRNLTQVDIYQIIDWMKTYKDIKFLFHTHEDNLQKYIYSYKKIAEIANYDNTILDRILVGTWKHAESEIKEIKNLGYFKNIEYDLKKKAYRSDNLTDINDIIKYLKENDIKIVSFSINAIKEAPNELLELKKNDFFVFSFNTNDVKEAQKYLKMGVNMIGTDFIEPTFFSIKSTQKGKKYAK